jgi:hypothetical protein
VRGFGTGEVRHRKRLLHASTLHKRVVAIRRPRDGTGPAAGVTTDVDPDYWNLRVGRERCLARIEKI